MARYRVCMGALVAALALALGARACAAQALKPWLCPPKQFDSVANFNLAKFVAAPWYVQSQLPLKSQPAADLNCVRASYVPNDAKDFSKGVRVCNYANRGAVNGPAVGTCLTVRAPGGAAPFQMAALPWPASRSAPETLASKLLVGPTSVVMSSTPEQLARPPMPGTQRMAGPYWVVATGPSKTPALGYDWAIISGGAPSQATPNDACLPPGTGDAGLWLFHRQPVAPKADLDAMMAAAKALRLDTSRLVPVNQVGCKYAGAAR